MPSHLNDALVSYVSGLQAEGARQRLKDAARTVTTETVTFIRAEISEAKDDSMDTYEARRAALEAAEQLELEKLTRLGIDLGKIDDKENRLKMLQEKKETDRRSALLLKALIGDTDTDDSAEDKEEDAPEPVLETARARKKKRRSRTEVDSDSDSSSDDDDDFDAPPKSKRVKVEAKPRPDSGSSDSSSGSDSGSDSSDSDSDSESGSGTSDSEDDSSEDDSSSDSE